MNKESDLRLGSDALTTNEMKNNGGLESANFVQLSLLDLTMVVVVAVVSFGRWKTAICCGTRLLSVVSVAVTPESKMHFSFDSIADYSDDGVLILRTLDVHSSDDSCQPLQKVSSRDEDSYFVHVWMLYLNRRKTVLFFWLSHES